MVSCNDGLEDAKELPENRLLAVSLPLLVTGEDSDLVGIPVATTLPVADEAPATVSLPVGKSPLWDVLLPVSVTVVPLLKRLVAELLSDESVVPTPVGTPVADESLMAEVRVADMLSNEFVLAPPVADASLAIREADVPEDVSLVDVPFNENPLL